MTTRKTVKAKAAPKKAVVRKTPVKKPVPKKAVVKKTVAKKTAPKKTTVKKTVAKKTPVKKAAPKKTVAKKAPIKQTIKKTPAKKAVPAKNPARKPKTRKKPIGFEMMKSYQNQIEKTYETMQNLFDGCGELLNDFIYNGKKKNAALSRAQLMNITKEAKNLRNTIQEAKTKLKPIYKTN